MNTYLVECLKQGRLDKGLKQSDVTKLTGIKNTTLSNYENGNTEPDMDTFLKLCQLYDLDYATILSEAYGYHLPGLSIDIKKSDIDLIKKYRSLDSFGRETVDYILDRELARTNQLENASSAAAAMRIYTYVHKIACAGNGFYFEDIPTDQIEAPELPGTDFIIGVSGDSMEPTFQDGDKLYVQKAQIVETGEMGIFMINNECFVKEAGEMGLKSHNPKYKLIPGNENIICVGKVLGKVE